MRLDKFIGKASGSTILYVYDFVNEDNELFYCSCAGDFIDMRKEMRKYKVKYYKIVDNKLIVFVKGKNENENVDNVDNCVDNFNYCMMK